MSGDPFSTFSPSDSGFLNDFLPASPAQSRPLVSRIGEEGSAGNCDPSLSADANTTGFDPESVLDIDPAEIELTIAEIDRRLLDVALPAEYLAKLQRQFSG